VALGTRSAAWASRRGGDGSAEEESASGVEDAGVSKLSQRTM